ncbi:MAG: phosphate ABC transporter permease subunit PstC [Rhodocyclaceae bacterium]|nr:phosphate ABC transporter permease subunit PstC [Rhodocyclaceae bacterium]
MSVVTRDPGSDRRPAGGGASTLLRSRRRSRRERVIESGLFLAAILSVLVTVVIVSVLLIESLAFFRDVSLARFVTELEWTPLFDEAHFGILVLLSGTITATAVALLVAIPAGTAIAVYLSEFASPRTRDVAKPLLELLGGVPTIVYGYFALVFVTPMLQSLIPSLPTFNLLSAGLVMGVMIIPYVSSLSEDAMRAVPMGLREASYAVGATRLQTAFGVVVPSAVSGIGSAYVLGISRAIGETMIVAIAAGAQARLTFDPTQSAATLTSYIVQVAQGDVDQGSIGYRTIFVAGLALMLLTLVLNVAGHLLRRRFAVKGRIA